MNETHHPAPAAIRAAMNRLERAVGAFPAPKVEMTRSTVFTEEGCGTIACHGGWYALGCVLDQDDVNRDSDDCFTWEDPIPDVGAHGTRTYLAPRKADGQCWTWTMGADLLAGDLGFTESWNEVPSLNRTGAFADYVAPHNALENWAADHPELWGNPSGIYMFALPHAFGHDAPAEDLTVQDIIAHWRGVADRIEGMHAWNAAQQQEGRQQ